MGRFDLQILQLLQRRRHLLVVFGQREKFLQCVWVFPGLGRNPKSFGVLSKAPYSVGIRQSLSHGSAPQ